MFQNHKEAVITLSVLAVLVAGTAAYYLWPEREADAERPPSLVINVPKLQGRNANDAVCISGMLPIDPGYDGTFAPPGDPAAPRPNRKDPKTPPAIGTHLYYATKTMSVQKLINSIVPVEGGQVLFAFYSAGAEATERSRAVEKGWYLFPDSVSESSTVDTGGEATYGIGDPTDYQIAPYEGFVMFSCKPTAIYNIKSETDIPDGVISSEYIENTEGWVLLPEPFTYFKNLETDVDNPNADVFESIIEAKLKSIWLQGGFGFDFPSSSSYTDIDDATEQYNDPETTPEYRMIWVKLGEPTLSTDTGAPVYAGRPGGEAPAPTRPSRPGGEAPAPTRPSRPGGEAPGEEPKPSRTNSPPSRPSQLSLTNPPGQVQNLIAKPYNCTNMLLTWDAVPDSVGYTIAYTVQGDTTSVSTYVDGRAVTRTLIEGLESGTTYEFLISAQNAESQQGSWSDLAIAIPECPPSPSRPSRPGAPEDEVEAPSRPSSPSRPTRPTRPGGEVEAPNRHGGELPVSTLRAVENLKAIPCHKSVKLTWDPVSDEAVVGYTIDYITRSTDNRNEQYVEDATAENAIILSLENNTEYFFVMRTHYGGSSEGPETEAVSATPSEEDAGNCPVKFGPTVGPTAPVQP